MDLSRAVQMLILIAIIPVFTPQARIRILPLGDSITEGDPIHGSYRCHLWKMLRDAGFDVDFVGSKSDAQGLDEPWDTLACDPDHEGHNGWTTGNVLEMLPQWLCCYTPDIALIHLGTNDWGTLSAIHNLEAIIDSLRAVNPLVKVLLAQIIPMGFDQSQTVFVHFNAAIGEIPERKSTSMSPVVVVDHFSGFDVKTDTYDWVHPNEAGSKKMAATWFESLKPILLSNPVSSTFQVRHTIPSPVNTRLFDVTGRSIRRNHRGIIVTSEGNRRIRLHSRLTSR